MKLICYIKRIYEYEVVNIRKIISFLLTSIVLVGINYGLTVVLNVDFIDYSFVVGLFGIVFIYFFSSSGGFSSKHLDMQIQGQTGIRMDQQKGRNFYPSIAFYTAVFYTICSIIAIVYTYKDYY